MSIEHAIWKVGAKPERLAPDWRARKPSRTCSMPMFPSSGNHRGQVLFRVFLVLGFSDVEAITD